MTTQETPTVLIIDDSAPVRDITADMLRLFNYRVLTAKNGAEGLDVYQQHTVDLILLDVNMPVMDGAATFRALRQINPSVNVVVCSSEPQSTAQQCFGELHIPAFLHKPFDTGKLLDTVQSTLP